MLPLRVGVHQNGRRHDNPKKSEFVEPVHPSVLRFLQRHIQAHIFLLRRALRSQLLDECRVAACLLFGVEDIPHL